MDEFDNKLIETIRAEIARRLEDGRASLRGLAREIGMSPTGLQKFIDGTQPYRPTQVKLHRWYVSLQASGAADLTDYLLAQLAGTFPAASRAAVRRELDAAVRRLRDQHPTPAALPRPRKPKKSAAGPPDTCRLCIPPREVPLGQLHAHMREVHGTA